MANTLNKGSLNRVMVLESVHDYGTPSCHSDSLFFVVVVDTKSTRQNKLTYQTDHKTNRVMAPKNTCKSLGNKAEPHKLFINI